jgi:hypothetical protein
MIDQDHYVTCAVRTSRISRTTCLEDLGRTNAKA